MASLPPDLDRIVARLKERYAPERIILFGSYARGTADRHSDLDLLIVKQTTRRPMDRRIDVRRIAQGPDIQIPFSPLVYTPDEFSTRLQSGDAFLRTVLAEGVTLHGR